MNIPNLLVAISFSSHKPLPHCHFLSISLSPAPLGFLLTLPLLSLHNSLFCLALIPHYPPILLPLLQNASIAQFSFLCFPSLCLPALLTLFPHQYTAWFIGQEYCQEYSKCQTIFLAVVMLPFSPTTNPAIQRTPCTEDKFSALRICK